MRPASWREPEPPRADFFAAKGVLAALLDALRVPWETVRGSDPFLHPGRAARVLVAGGDAGWLGELHPGVAGEWDLEATAGFELDLGAVFPYANVAPHYEDLTSFPSLRLDLAFWMPPEITGQASDQTSRASGASESSIDWF